MEKISPEEMFEALNAEVEKGNQGPPADLQFEVIGAEEATGQGETPLPRFRPTAQALSELMRAQREKSLPHQMQVGENIPQEYK